MEGKVRRYTALGALLWALTIVPGAAASYNITQLGEHWPTTVTDYNHSRGYDCPKVSPWTRCIVVFDRTGFPKDSYFNGQLVTALNHLYAGEGQPYLSFVRSYRDVRWNLETHDGYIKTADRKFFGAIVLGYGNGWEVNFSYGELDNDPEYGDLPDYYAAADNIERTGQCTIALDNRFYETTEHELGHCIGLTHWPLSGPPNYGCLDEWDGGLSIMCGLGEGRMGDSDYASIHYLYDHIDDYFGTG